LLKYFAGQNVRNRVLFDKLKQALGEDEEVPDTDPEPAEPDTDPEHEPETETKCQNLLCRHRVEALEKVFIKK